MIRADYAQLIVHFPSAAFACLQIVALKIMALPSSLTDNSSLTVQNPSAYLALLNFYCMLFSTTTL